MRTPLFRRLKIVAILILAYIVSAISSSSIFIAGTPRVNMDLITQIWQYPQTVAGNLGRYTSQLLSGGGTSFFDIDKVRRALSRSSPVETKSAPTSESPSTRPRDDTTALLGTGYALLKDGIYIKDDSRNRYIDVRILSDKPFTNRSILLGGRSVSVMMREE